MRWLLSKNEASAVNPGIFIFDVASFLAEPLVPFLIAPTELGGYDLPNPLPRREH
jgi:hypothetical protein